MGSMGVGTPANRRACTCRPHATRREAAWTFADPIPARQRRRTRTGGSAAAHSCGRHSASRGPPPGRLRRLADRHNRACGQFRPIEGAIGRASSQQRPGQRRPIQRPGERAPGAPAQATAAATRVASPAAQQPGGVRQPGGGERQDRLADAGRARRLHRRAAGLQVVQRGTRHGRQGERLHHRLPVAPAAARSEHLLEGVGEAPGRDLGADHHPAAELRREVGGADRRWEPAGTLLPQSGPECRRRSTRRWSRGPSST